MEGRATVIKWILSNAIESYSPMKFGVVVFPGSNCDHDAFYAVGNILKKPVEFIWHQSEDLAGCDSIILPGGFAHGDYLRTGAIARFSPVMKSVEKFAKSGGIVLGICNGFQILLEAGLLPGAMMRNKGLRYICRHVYIRVEETDTPVTCAANRGQVLRIPIAHNEGNYNCDEATMAELEKNRQILFRYTSRNGASDDEGNPNGSMCNIAGICNRERNVAGLMPHPERAMESALDSADGRVIFQSLVSALAGAAKATA
jgi:phosphoribosylformylglycinamidine synthase subunit PurQ / glutaminase